jgi:sphinganine C4-monooxygenase
MVPWEGYVSDETMGTFAPIALYWVYAGGYQLILHRRPLQRYRLHTQAEEDEKNLVSVPAVIRGVLLQQLVQAIVAMILFMVRTKETASSLPLPFLIISEMFSSIIPRCCVYFVAFKSSNQFSFRVRQTNLVLEFVKPI